MIVRDQHPFFQSRARELPMRDAVARFVRLLFLLSMTLPTAPVYAAGTEPLPAERAGFWAKQDKVVIAVHQNGPISVQVAPQTPAITQR